MRPRMERNDVDGDQSNTPKRHVDDVENLTASDQTPSFDHKHNVASQPTIPLAADPTHKPAYHCDFDLDTDKEKQDSQCSQTDTDSQLGELHNVQSASNRPVDSDSSAKKLTVKEAVIIFVTNEVGIGMLSLPAALNVLGFFPGVFCIIVMGMLSLYTAYNLIQYWRRYPYMLNIVDYGRPLGGRFLEAVFAVGFLINMALISASALITITIGLNTLSDHATCTVAFTVVSAVAMWAMCVPHSMSFVSMASWACTASIGVTVLVVMIVLGVDGPRDKAPLNLKAVGNPSFVEATSAFLNIAFAYTGNQAFPTVLVELKNPSRDFPRAVAIEKCITTTIYVIVASTVYALSGSQVASPAIGTLNIIPAKVAYGLILIGLLGTGLIFGMTSARYLDVFILRHLSLFKIGAKKPKQPESSASDSSPSSRSSKPAVPEASPTTKRMTWLFSVTVFWILVWILANAIPVFDSLLNISSSLLLSWFTWGITVLFWFHLNWNGRWRSSWQKLATAALNCAIMVMVCFMMAPGMYASIVNLLTVFNDPNKTVNGPFTCADNSLL